MYPFGLVLPQLASTNVSFAGPVTMSLAGVSTTGTPGAITVVVTTPTVPTVVSYSAPTTLFSVDSMGYSWVTYTLATTLYTQCGDPKDKYEFGFNGQMKMNEIAGVGNHNTAKFWEYDTRLGRRWNIDPIKKHEESNYACENNSPISRNDINGDDGKGAVAIEFITQEVAGAATATGIGAAAVPVIEIIGGAVALWQLLEDVPIAIPATPPATPPASVRQAPTQTKPVIQKTEAKKIEKAANAQAHGGGKNAAHANQKARDAAEKRYNDKKAERDELDKKRDKTPEEKKELEKLEKQVKHEKKRMDNTGENHSRKAKGSN